MKMQLLLHETIKTSKLWCKGSKFRRNPGINIVQKVTKMIQCTFYAIK